VNRPIRRIALVAMAMFAALLLNVSYTAIFREQALDDHAQNRRVRDEQFAQNRGAILVGNTAIARSAPVKDAFKYQRSYASGKLYAPVTGFYSYDYARAGLENSYNAELAGTDPSLFVSNIVDRLTGKTPTGATIETTIDARAQKAAYEGLKGKKGAVVAIEPRTGKILALVSTPSYDPNDIASHDLAAARRSWNSLLKDADRPLADRATHEIYPPGSTFKLITAAAALENGYTSTSQIASPSSLTLPQSSSKLTNQVNCGGAKVSLDRALQTSCNTAFANLGLALGQDKLRAQAQKFGFDARQLDDLNGAASRFPSDLDRPQTALSAIGQYDVAASPLQMAMVAAAIANDGKLMEPYLVQTVRSADLSVISRHHTNVQSEAMSSENAKQLADMMVNVVDQGTGTPAKIYGKRVGGKTGTAQWDLSKKPYAWFVAFADNPDVAVAVFIEDADVARTDVAGGRLAGPIAKDVIEALS